MLSFNSSCIVLTTSIWVIGRWVIHLVVGLMAKALSHNKLDSTLVRYACSILSGALTVFLYCFREREEILRIFDDISGQRMMTSYFRIGGVALEPPLDFCDRVRAFLKSMPETFDPDRVSLLKEEW